MIKKYFSEMGDSVSNLTIDRLHTIRFVSSKKVLKNILKKCF